MIDNPTVRVALAILNAFIIIAAGLSAYFTALEIGYMPVLALSIKGFLLGLAISAALYMANDSARGRDFSFFLGFGLLSLYASILMIAGAVLLTTLLFFIVGILTIYSDVASILAERADDFVILAAVVGIGIYLVFAIGPSIWAIGLSFWEFGAGNLWVSIGSVSVYIFLITVVPYSICRFLYEWLSE